MMQNDPGKIISQFLAQLESCNVTSNIFKQFLIALQVLPLDLPLLQGMGNFFSGGKNNLVTQNMERRYRRIAFVQQSLEKINFSKAKPETRFEDFIFEQTDFSIYEKIDAETFQLFYIDGLDDLSDDFYTKTFFRNKDEIRKIIFARCKLIGGFYASDGNPLLIPIMRSIHTSLDFTPFPNSTIFFQEMKTLFEFLHHNANLPNIFFRYLSQEKDNLFCNLLLQFDKTEVINNDKTTSRFFISKENNKIDLFAVFNSEGKSFTKLMTSCADETSQHIQESLSSADVQS
jgi:hypothetical protein